MKNIILKYLTDNITDIELKKLLNWLEKPKNLKKFQDYIKENYNLNILYGDINEEIALQKVKRSIQNQEKSVFFNKRHKRNHVIKYMAAAIVVGILTTTYFFRNNLFNTPIYTTPIIVNTNIIEPGTNKATLTLEDGTTVILEKGSTYQIENANSNGEQIIYDTVEQNPTKIVYNYLSIPRGGEYHIILSDGTQVWLNSESQLKYPVSFIEGETRQVELVYGEAYFDVSPSAAHKGTKFKVFNQFQEVEVLGTEFNIKAYKDETNIYTTLVEGKVAVSFENEKQNLTPNQQSNWNPYTNLLSVNTVNVYNEVSWKYGVLSFDGKPLKEIMKILSRWYDRDIVFLNKTIEDTEFVGVLRRNKNLEDIILNIKNFGIIKDYEIKDKIVILK